MQLPLFQVDAFTNRLFHGNPAGVVLLEEWLDDERMQAIALENNLSETAFVVAEGGGFRIRWFTPTVEVNLCGHATLAAAHVLFRTGKAAGDAIRFASRSGELRVGRDGDLIELDFPADPPRPLAADDPTGQAIAAALGRAPDAMLAGRYHAAVFAAESDVADIAPDIAALAAIPHYAVVCTAPGIECDFVSRFFGPRVGVVEDPVTGSAHCMLVPYWAGRLDKRALHARQLSRRGGELFCCDHGQRVRIAGRAVDYMEGSIRLD